MMEPELIFKLANLVALAGWVVLFASRWVLALQGMVTGAVVPILLGVAYVGLLLAGMPGVEGGFGTLAEVKALFGSETLVLAGWLHYLAFDLLVGTWVWRDAHRKGIPWFAALPALVLTFLAGPAGFLLHVLVRAGFTKSLHPSFAG